MVTLNVRVLQSGAARTPQPVPGVEVFILQNRRAVTSRRTDLGGRTSFRLRSGRYGIGVKDPKYGVGRDTLTLVAGSVNRDIYLKQSTPTPEPGPTPGPEPGVLPVAGRLQLQVAVLKPAIRGQRGQQTSPLPGATVTVGQGDLATPGASGTSDRMGNFSKTLRPGRYWVHVTHPSLSSANLDFTIPPQGGVVNHRVVLRQRTTPQPGPGPSPGPGPTPGPDPDAQPVATTLTVQVRGATSRGGRLGQSSPLGGASVKILQGGRLVGSGQSDKSGRFSKALTPGSYQLYVAHPNFAPARESVTVARGTGATHQIILYPSGSTSPKQTPRSPPSTAPLRRRPAIPGPINKMPRNQLQ